MKAGRQGEVRLEDEGKGCKNAFSAGTRVSDEETGLCGVINALGSIDELANLEGRDPDSPIAASNCPTPSVGEQFAGNKGTAQTEKP